MSSIIGSFCFNSISVTREFYGKQIKIKLFTLPRPGDDRYKLEVVNCKKIKVYSITQQQFINLCGRFSKLAVEDYW